MDNDIKDLMDENEIQRRMKLHQGLRKVLLVINLLFAFYLVTQLVKVCYRNINGDRDKNYSTKIDKLMNDGENSYKVRSIQIRDYLLYGDNLSLFYYDYDVSANNDYFVKDEATFRLLNLDNNKEYVYDTSLYLDQNINLSDLDEGTYLLFYKEDSVSDDYIVTYEAYNPDKEYIFYSLPYKSERKDQILNKKISINAIYSNSFPLVTIEVEEEKLLSNKGYDIAINYNVENCSESLALYLKTKFKDIGLNVYLNKYSSSDSSKTSFYKFIYDNDIKYAMDLRVDETAEIPEYIHSYKINGYLDGFVPNSSTLSENGVILDEDLFIRELGGRGTGTGLCKGEESGTISCSMGDRKDEMGVSAIVVTIPSVKSEIAIRDYGDLIFTSFVEKYVK